MDIFTLLLYVTSFVSAVVIGCLWVPSIERMIGYCVVQVGLIIAGAGLKLSVYGGRMVDDARSPVVVPCDCSVCRREFLDSVTDDEEYAAYLDHLYTPNAENY